MMHVILNSFDSKDFFQMSGVCCCYLNLKCVFYALSNSIILKIYTTDEEWKYDIHSTPTLYCYKRHCLWHFVVSKSHNTIQETHSSCLYPSTGTHYYLIERDILLSCMLFASKTNNMKHYMSHTDCHWRGESVKVSNHCLLKINFDAIVSLRRPLTFIT